MRQKRRIDHRFSENLSVVRVISHSASRYLVAEVVSNRDDFVKGDAVLGVLKSPDELIGDINALQFSESPSMSHMARVTAYHVADTA